MTRSNASRSQVGLSLVELTVVMIIAGLATLGLMTFYLHSQGLWMDASSQSMVQRDATLLLEEISEKVRMARSATVMAVPDTLHQRLILFDNESGSGPEAYAFWWDPDDSLIHLGSFGSEDPNPIVASKIAVFQIDTNDTLVYLHRLVMAPALGAKPVEINSSVRMYNR